MIDRKTTDYEVNLALSIIALYGDEPHRWDEKYAEYDEVYRPLFDSLKETLGDDYEEVIKAFRNGIQEG